MVTYGDRKYSIAKVLGLCPNDSRVMEYCNRAQSELTNAVEDFKGKHARIRLCIVSGNITWPPFIENIERLAGVDECCVWKTKMRDFWFEFLDNAIPPQQQDQQWYGGITTDRGNSPVWDQIRGTSKKLKVYTDVQEAANASVRITGTSISGTEIRTLNGGSWQNGETLLLNNVTPPVTTNVYGSVTGLFFSGPRNGYARLYEVDTDTLEERLIGLYAPWQTRPEFRQSFVSGVCVLEEEQTRTIQVIAKLKPLPIYNDEDVLIIQNENALNEMCKAIKERDNNEPTSKLHRDAAIQLLKEEFNNWHGMSPRSQITVQRQGSWGYGTANVRQGWTVGGWWGGR